MRICVFGDSITFGSGDTEIDGWVGRLRARLQKQDPTIQVMNRGISGDTTPDLLARMDQECSVDHPDAVLIAIGINDAAIVTGIHKNRVEINRFEENLKSLIRIARKHTPRIGLIGLTGVIEHKTSPVPWHPEITYLNKEITRFTTRIEELCAQQKLPYVSLATALAPADLPDGLHPNNQGYAKLAARISMFLEQHQLLQEEVP
jgi:lysophospholipase L1-like esterase